MLRVALVPVVVVVVVSHTAKICPQRYCFQCQSTSLFYLPLFVVDLLAVRLFCQRGNAAACLGGSCQKKMLICSGKSYTRGRIR